MAEPRDGTVLDELGVLATVVHALIVEYLTVECALGHDLDAADGGPTTDRCRDAASAAGSLAVNEMFQFKAINQVLVDEGREARFDRADLIDGVSLTPPDRPALEHLLARELAIATAVDAAFARLPADWLARIGADGRSRVADLASLRAALTDAPHTEFLRADRRTAADDAEQRLLDMNDRIYTIVLTALRGALDPVIGADGTLRLIATSSMNVLNDANRLLVRQHLLPPFPSV